MEFEVSKNGYIKLKQEMGKRENIKLAYEALGR